jgi:hypothetical protein
VADARIRVSLQEGLVEIEGSESFVAQHAEKFGEAIRKALAGIPRATEPISIATAPKKAESTESGEDGSSAQYSDAFEVHEGKVQVLKDLPGASSREKTVNAGVICAFAKDNAGSPTVTFNEVRQICRDHSCLDSPNFATALKKDGKEFFVFSGGGKSQALKLSVPGKKKARELISAMRT